MTTLEAALEYARRNWPVFPITPRAKKLPLTRHGFKDASTDEHVIRAWWARWPDANVGIATGHRSFVVVDLDIKEDRNGMEMFLALLKANVGEDENGNPNCQRATPASCL